MRKIIYLTTFFLAFSLAAFIVSSFQATKQKSVNAEIEIKSEEINLEDFAKGVGTDSKKPVGRGFAIGHGEQNRPAYVPKLHKPTCTDEKLLPVWNELKKDEKFQEYSKEFYMNADCSEMFEIQKMDLNNDGQKEIILWGTNGNLCGATGICALWIYGKNKTYKKLLHGFAYNDGTNKWIEVNNRKNRNYKSLKLRIRSGALVEISRIYIFNGKEYKEKSCLYEKFSFDRKTSSIISCKEAWGNK